MSTDVSRVGKVFQEWKKKPFQTTSGNTFHNICLKAVFYVINTIVMRNEQERRQMMAIKHKRISNQCAAFGLIRQDACCIVPSPFCSLSNWHSDNFYVLESSLFCLQFLFKICPLYYSSEIIQRRDRTKTNWNSTNIWWLQAFHQKFSFYQFLIKQGSSQTPTKLIFWITVPELFFSISEAQLSDLCHSTDSFICGRGVYEILQLPGSQWLCTDLHNSVCIPTPGGRNTAYITLPFSAS